MTPDYLTRRFPFTVRPAHRETLHSYTARVLEANGEPTTLPQQLVKLAHTVTPDATWADVLAVKVGRSLDRLVVAPAANLHGGTEECLPCRALLPDRWACILCTHGERVQQHPHLDDFVCETHRRWTGPGSTPEDQPDVGVKQLQAQRALVALRREGRADMQLLADVLAALARDTDEPSDANFATAVSVIAWVAQEDTVRRLFDPFYAYAETFAWVQQSLNDLAGREVPTTIVAVWRHLHPAFVALQAAFRGYRSYRAGHPHDFALPADVTTWYPRSDRVQTAMEYLACIGDKNLSRVAQGYHDDNAPTVQRPLLTSKHCGRGHAYLDVATAIERDEKHFTPCPRCTRAHVRVGENDLATVAPHLAEELHETLNGSLTATDIAAASKTTVWWTCRAKGHPFRGSPANRTLTDAGCAVCLNRVILVGVNDLATTNPRIAQELHPSRASAKRATQLHAGDTKKRLWLCHQRGHEFTASVQERVKGKVTCPDCKKERNRTSGRNLVDTHPTIAAEWLPELNEGREPADYTQGSKLEVIWWCHNGPHPFPMRIQIRTKGGDCPFCAGRLLLVGFNDFATTHPALASEWHPWKNRKYPSEVMAGSNDKHHFKCRDGHETHQSIPNRRESGGCTRCASGIRVGIANQAR